MTPSAKCDFTTAETWLLPHLQKTQNNKELLQKKEIMKQIMGKLHLFEKDCVIVWAPKQQSIDTEGGLFCVFQGQKLTFNRKIYTDE